MKVLAISDNLINQEMLKNGLKELVDQGAEVTIKDWSHDTIENLQNDNLAIEQHGANAVELGKEFFESIDEYDVIITQFAPIGKKLIEKAQKLHYIGVLRGGIENIDQEAAAKQGIEVVNTPGRNARAVAEFTVGLILAEIRNIARSHEGMKNNIWLKDFPNKEAIPELGEQTVGLVGMGNIGKYVAQFLEGFGTKIVYYDPFLTNALDYEQAKTIDELVEKSDIVSLHLRLSEDTHRIINRDVLEKMKPTTYLINTARSGLIDEKALLDVLKNKKIMGAALDTFDDEPLPADSPFLELDNVTMTPHLAGSTIDAFKNTPRLLAKILLSKIELP
ncbi:2-hydroxyacid dehydrogenase [Vagococcus sp. DIV0080]|uniref:2-hydroxyacid dehydrogenase n=1 Tax=Candidatus Vagococcus giribetii TaxID=2230876 RepID=A0ABS3HTM3_9ENTE|nr:2-hydroxyacid dehydrogenase [Vagococcus sp. DIV0080]MBO0476690.1 2-hydroxyacid dehydrogenase [Vagococcus sp. DIV0080]